MSSHQNSAYNSESLMQVPSRSVPVRRYSLEPGRPWCHTGQPLRASRPPDQIWGQYNNYRANGVAVSAIVHVALVVLLLSGVFVSHQITQRQERQVVTLIAPSPDTYALPVAKKVISGGGGGGDRDVLPAPKGHPPKTALQQITPPAIVMRNEKPKLAVEPTVVVPPQVHLAENHMPTLGTSTGSGDAGCAAFEWHWLRRRHRLRIGRRTGRGTWAGRRRRNWRGHWGRGLPRRRRHLSAHGDLVA